MTETKTIYTQASDIQRKVFAIDFDGILTDNNYANPAPVQRVCDKVQELYNNGHIIIIWTARPWSYAPQLVAWLTRFDVPFHGVQMFKGGADAYVDDKNMALRTFMGLE
jgi:hypothetical protein